MNDNSRSIEKSEVDFSAIIYRNVSQQYFPMLQIKSRIDTQFGIIFSSYSEAIMGKYPYTYTKQFARVIIKVKGHQYWWLAGGDNLERGHF